MARILHEKINEKMDNNERTPLIATIHIAPPRQRYQHSTIRRFFTIASCSSLVAVLLVWIFPVGFFLPHRHHEHRPLPDPRQNAITFKELQDIMLETPKEEKAQEWSKYYT